jgi:DedD protein
MESPLKQRLIGAAVLAALAIIFLPMLLKGPDVKSPDAAQVPLEMPASPDQKFETRELPLGTPITETPAGGVLGMDTSPTDAAGTVTSPVATAPMPTPDTTSQAVPLEAAGAPVSATPLPPTPAPVAVTPPKPVPAPVATKPAAPPIPAAAVAGGDYLVSIGSFGNLDNANTLVGKLRAAKLPVVADKVDVGGKPAMRVRIGPFADRAAAESARQRADAIAGSSSKVVATDAVATKPAVEKPVATKPAAEQPAAPVAKPASASGFAVQLAAPSIEADAMALRDKARAAGFSAFVQRVDTDGGARFRVRVGPVADRPSAESLRDSVNQKLGQSGIVVSNP